jgi:hypothetical protein
MVLYNIDIYPGNIWELSLKLRIIFYKSYVLDKLLVSAGGIHMLRYEQTFHSLFQLTIFVEYYMLSIIPVSKTASLKNVGGERDG